MPTWNEAGERVPDWDAAPTFKSSHEFIEWTKREMDLIEQEKDHERLYALMQPHLEAAQRAQQRQQVPNQAAQPTEQLQQLAGLAPSDPARAVAAAYQLGDQVGLGKASQAISENIDSAFAPEEAQRVWRARDAFAEAKRVGRAEAEADKRRKEAPTTTTRKPMRSHFAASAVELGYQPHD